MCRERVVGVCDTLCEEQRGMRGVSLWTKGEITSDRRNRWGDIWNTTNDRGYHYIFEWT